MDLMDRHLAGKGHIVGLDIGPEMLEQGFDEFRAQPHYLGYVRVLAARKGGE